MKKLKSLLRRRKKNSGFTLVELVVSCGLLGILVVGVTAFIGPVLKTAGDSEKDVRATLLAQTMDEYVNRSIRDSYYVAIFTNADRTMVGKTGSISQNENILAMKDFVDQNKEVYELKCFSYSWTEDTQSNEYKYMLMSEKFQEATTALETSSTTDPKTRRPIPVFEDCFYDGLFPQIEVEQLKGKAPGADSSESVSTGDDSGSGEEVDIPAIKTTFNIYTTENMANPSFIGYGYTEFINVRAASDENKTKKFKFYPIEDMESTAEHPTTFIYYVARKPSKFDVPVTP